MWHGKLSCELPALQPLLRSSYLPMDYDYLHLQPRRTPCPCFRGMWISLNRSTLWLNSVSTTCTKETLLAVSGSAIAHLQQLPVGRYNAGQVAMKWNSGNLNKIDLVFKAHFVSFLWPFIVLSGRLVLSDIVAKVSCPIEFLIRHNLLLYLCDLSSLHYTGLNAELLAGCDCDWLTDTVLYFLVDGHHPPIDGSLWPARSPGSQ